MSDIFGPSLSSPIPALSDSSCEQPKQIKAPVRKRGQRFVWDDRLVSALARLKLKYPTLKAFGQCDLWRSSGPK